MHNPSNKMNFTEQLLPSIPLASRLDRLDFIMKYLERKQNSLTWKSGDDPEAHHAMPINLALREAHLKGSLIDQINSLERRLLQVCLEMESSRTWGPCTESGGTCPDTSGRRRESSRPSPVFSIPNNAPRHPQIQSRVMEIQEMSERESRRRLSPPPKRHAKKNWKEKVLQKKGGKGNALKCAQQRLLGC